MQDDAIHPDDTESLGVISLDGTFKRKVPRRGIRETTREIFEYGNGLLAHYMLKDVEEILSRSHLILQNSSRML